MKDKIQKAVDLYNASYDNFKGVLVFNNLRVYDTDYASILLEEDIFYFTLSDDEIEDFQVRVDDITDIKFDKMGDITITLIYLYNGDVISIFNL